MGVIVSNKVGSKGRIDKGGVFDVTLSLQGGPSIFSNPKDIALVLDRSGSMSGKPIDELKLGVEHFLDIIDVSTDQKKDSFIGNGSNIGLVSFSSDATIDSVLTTSVPKLKLAANRMSASGSTNHELAFTKAVELLNTSTSGNPKVIILFTDGDSNQGAEGYAVAEQAKKDGIEIYCVGFNPTGSLDLSVLEKWASAPTDEHILVAPDFASIETMFEDLAKTVSVPAATNGKLVDHINPCFEIVKVMESDRGNATIVDKNTIVWDFGMLGGDMYEKIDLRFTVKHVGPCEGVVNIDERYTYSDAEGNTIDLANPTVEIVSDVVDYREDCPIAYELVADGCRDYVTFDASEVTLENTGRIVEVGTTIKEVCPNKSVALATILSEVDTNGIEHQRGMKTIMIPPMGGSNCQDVAVKCIKFVVPEVLDVQGSPNSICNDRIFKVRFIANYVDSDYDCCKN